MQTRSATKKLIEAKAKNTPGPYEVNINFDEASEAWNANKVKLGNGMYKYICMHKGKTKCRRACLTSENYCKTHLTQLTRTHSHISN